MSENAKESIVGVSPCVSTITELWELIKDRESRLRVFLYTKDGLFDYILFRVWWVHGRFTHESHDDIEHSQIVFDIPDEAWKRIQSNYATKIMRRFFGSADDRIIPQAIRDQRDRDDTRQLKPRPFHGMGFSEEVITTDDWPRLKRAIKATAKSVPGGMSSDEIVLHGSIAAKARVVDDRLEICLDEAIDQAVKNWQSAIRKKLGFNN